MKAVFIGSNSEIADMAGLSLRIRWPDATPLVATTAAEGLASMQRASLEGGVVDNASPEVVLIHPSFSDMSLAEAIRKLRSFSNVPTVVLSDRGDETEAVTALEAGADDYVRLPCHLTEVMARVWALLRRAGDNQQRPEEERPISCGRLLLDPVSGQVFLGDRRLNLTYTEFKLLHFLMENRGVVIPHQTIETHIWGSEVDSSCLAKKYVQRLRRKLGDGEEGSRWIVNIHGAGYQFVGPSEAPWEIIVSPN